MSGSQQETRRLYAKGETVHEVFRWHSARQPDALAVVHGDETVTYAELDAWSDRLAVAMAARGVSPGDVVPVLMPRSARLVATLLAVLKSGAAYAALDTDWPSARVEQVLRLLAPPLLVCVSGKWPVPTFRPAEFSTDECVALAHANLAHVGGDAGCSVFFTSGTTGAPKGVLSPHRATVRLFTDCTFAQLGNGIVIPQAAPLPWDAMTLELWGALLSGGTSVLVDEAYILPSTLRKLVERDGVDTLWLTSSLFNMFVEEDLESFCGLRQVLIGGERLTISHVRRFLERYQSVSLVNGYGPVESTVFATTHSIRMEDCDNPAGIPIGRSVTKTVAYVMDGERLCAVGESGELCIGGDGLAVGYIGDPALTAEKFVWIEVNDERLRVYRTGDLAHLGSDGLLYFDGRADRQVKIRGHRIEPGGIERVVGGLPGIRSCAVLPLVGTGGSYDSLALFYTTTDGLSDGGREDVLRAQLRQLLPAYLIPDRILGLPEFPLTPNGKLNHETLLAAVTQPARQCRRPGFLTVTEELVAGVWADVLGIAPGRNDDFFTIGGHSLSAAQVITRLRDVFGNGLHVKMLFAAPVLHEFAAQIDVAFRSGQGLQFDRPANVDRSDHLPLSFLQENLLLREIRSRKSGIPSPPMHVSFAVEISGPIADADVQSAVTGLIFRHEALRTGFLLNLDDETAEQFILPEATALLSQVSITAGQPSEREHLLRRELADLSQHLFDLDRPPLVRAALCRFGQDDAVLLVVIHHLICDGRSVDILFREFAAHLRGEQHTTPLKFNYLEWAAWQRRMLNAEAGDRLVRYWRAALSGTVPFPLLKFPAPGSTDGLQARGEADIHLDASRFARLVSTTVACGATPFMSVLAAIVGAYWRVSGQFDVVVHSPCDNRTLEGAEHVVGWLAHSLVLRLQLDPKWTWKDLIVAARGVALEAFAHQDVPLPVVTKLLQPDSHGRARRRDRVFYAFHTEREDIEIVTGGALRMLALRDPDAVAQPGISVEAYRLSTGLTVRLVYNPRSVAGGYVGRLGEEIRFGLHQIADDVDQRIR